ncbi:putative small GTP-binding rab protein [Trypanosoma rangeli]|uniref:Putative small GTP-binding rab protein n=1 Tax=Trypanosoma rangeli TaxID=5698 RepID=A0A422NQU3_TRYRA|nr:putative small GTP-binding rab protein [Trypanosoma rangeli]RNF07867.1 putative small GTP-binding rab protein [Trypanosoma rangeli]|eukprot:RNF07867.1 putative small GTP-binding rab protein [Trypanosoma rangeli]
MSAVKASEHASRATETATATCDSSSGTESLEEREFVFKVAVVGDYGVGKTSLVNRLLSVPYTQHGEAADRAPAEESPAAGNPCMSVTPTVGTDFFSRVVQNVRPGQHVRLQFWDTAGLERYAAVHATTYRNASAVMVVFDVTDRRSFEALLSTHLDRAAHHNQELDQRSVVVVGNKTDLLLTSKETNSTSPAADVVTQLDVQSKLLDLLPGVVYHEVSALTNIGVKDLLHALCQTLLTVHGVEESTTSLPVEGAAAKQLQYSVLPKGDSSSPGVEAIAAAVPAPPADVKTPLVAEEYSPREVGDDNVAYGVTERHADPHRMPLSKSGEASEHTLPPFDRLHTAHLEETVTPIEDPIMGSSRLNSTGNNVFTQPPEVTRTVANNHCPQESLANEERREYCSLRSYSNLNEDDRRKPAECSSADSAEFQREIENRFRIAEAFARETAPALKQTPQPRKKKASKVNFSHCCGDGSESDGRNSKGFKC